MDIKNYISSGVIEDYAMGILPREDASILECVMSNNAEVKQAVIEVQETFEKLATIQAIQPPEYLKEEIRRRIEFGNSESLPGKIIPLNTKREETKRSSNISGWMKAASVALLIGLGFLGYEVGSKSAELEKVAQKNTELSTKITDLENMNSLVMNSQRIELKGVEKHPNMIADVYWHTSKKVFLEIKNLPEAPPGKQYQLWAIVDGKPVDMGMYSAKADSTVQEMKSVNNAQAFAITLEKEGGNPTPTMEEMYVMGTT
ncbi:anti-sigma factor [Kaistella polysaccharea]|uniref:anti-sigma factor n=1 Tax=Kaistella polysaccharea TaxID=2878534 RepID=UPI001CF25C4E|nr:anti-sigma factor [Kaistella polysaccharea]